MPRQPDTGVTFLQRLQATPLFSAVPHPGHLFLPMVTPFPHFGHLLMYSSEILEAVEYVRQSRPEAPVVTITNDAGAHVAGRADLSFHCRSWGEAGSTMISLVGPVSLINVVIEAVIRRRPDKARRAIARFQREILANSAAYFQFGGGRPVKHED